MANLLKWGKDRLKDAQGIYHQLNPADGGRTYDTNRRGVQPQQQQTQQLRNNNDNRNIIQRAVDQVNPADQNRTWKQAAPVGANRNAFHQVIDPIKTNVVQPTVDQALRAGTMINETPVGRLTGMPSQSQLIEDLASKQQNPQIADAIRTKGYQDILDKSGIGINDSKMTIGRKAVSDIGGTAANFIPVGAGVKGAMGAKALLRPTLESAAAGAVGSGLATAHDTNDARQILTSAAMGGALGGAFPIVGAGGRKVMQEVLPSARTAPDALPAQNTQPDVNPAVLELNDTMTRINQQREQMLAGGMPETHPALKANAEAYQMAAAERNNVMAQQMQPPVPAPIPEPQPRGLFGMRPLNEEGFAKVPGRKVPEQQVPEQAVLKQNLADSSIETPAVQGRKTPSELPQTGPQEPLVNALPKASPDSSGPPVKLNVDKFNITKKGKKALREAEDGLRAEVEKARGAPLTGQEVADFQEQAGAILRNPRTREATKEYLAQTKTLRENNAALVEKRAKGKLSDAEAAQLNEGLVKQYQVAADAGRVLQALSRGADPKERTVLDAMLQNILKRTDDTKAVIEASKKLGANPTPKELAEFYRTFVKANKEDWLDKYRYTNMLSSPLTHIVNMTSNMTGVAGVAPIQKLYEGGVDAVRAGVTRTPRKQFAGEAGAYYKGVKDSFKEAVANASDVMSGKKVTQNPDMDSLRNVPLATSGAPAAFDKILSFVPKLLEAGDQFGSTLARGGEKGAYAKRVAKGVDNIDLPEVKLVNGKRTTKNVNKKLTDVSIVELADDAAKYRVFRQEMKKAGQGHLLDMIDIPVGALQGFRTSENPYIRNLAKFSIPFIATPTNLFKQGIEYSPAGVLTLHGASNKTAQAAKSLMGATAMATVAGALAAGGDITFNEPSNSDQRNAFRAEGKQPYAFRVPGTDKWINYSKSHPAIAINFATVAAVKEAFDKGSITESGAEKALNIMAGVANYYTDQSYMKSVGDVVNIFQGKDNTNAQTMLASQATNTANQLVPLKSLTSWIGRAIDSTQRKVDSKANTVEQITQGIIKDIPGLNKNVPTRDNPYTGEPLKNQYPLINSVSPNRITKDGGYGNTTGLNIDQRELIRDLPKGEKEAYRRGIVEDKATEKRAKEEEQAIKDGRETPFKSDVKQGSAKDNKSGNGDIKQLSSGKVMARVDGEYKKFDNKKKAQEAIDGSNFASSGAKKKVIGDKVYLKDDDSDKGYKVKKKVEYDYDQVDSQTALDMDRAKGNDDLDSWLTSAQKKMDALDKLKKSYDSDTEGDKINDITKKMEDLRDQADKYQEYGGFKKGKSGGRGKGGTGRSKNAFQAPKGGGVDPVATAIKTNKLVTSGKVSAKRLRRKF